MTPKLTIDDLLHLGIEQGDLQQPQLPSYFDPNREADWMFMRGKPRSCFTLDLLSQIELKQLRSVQRHQSDGDISFAVVASAVEGVFNLGGDLSLFSQAIIDKDRAALLDYALKCVQVINTNMNHHSKDLISISLVQGDALGGGFEAAISSNILVAEKGAKMGMPEVLFNLFPGMGAWTFLSRKMQPAKARDLILSGNLYSAEEMHEMGVVDILAEPGFGVDAVNNFMDKARRAPNSYKALNKIMDYDMRWPTHQELIDITTLWADSALNITEKDIRMMKRLVSRQNKL